MSFVQSAQDSLLSLYLINDYKHGGFGFDQTDIGWLYTGIGPIQIIFNHILSINQSCIYFIHFIHFTSLKFNNLLPSSAPLVYPLLVELMSYQDVYFWSGFLYSLFLLFYPIISLFNQSNEIVHTI